MYGTVTLLQILSKFACRCTLENRWQPSLGWRWRWLPCEVGEYKFQARSSDPQQFALALIPFNSSPIVLQWKWKWSNIILRPATICAPSRFLHCVELEVVNVFDIATKKNRILLYLLFAKCHILGHQFSVFQLICFYLLVNSKGNSRSKLWQTQRQGGGEEILSHENGCASAASMRSRILGICWWSRGEPGSYVNCMQGKCRQNRQWQESCWRLCSWKTFIASGSKLKS